MPAEFPVAGLLLQWTTFGCQLRKGINKLRQASSAVKIPRPKALDKGYRPCKICKP